MPVLTGIRKVEYRQTRPTLGPYVQIESVRKVVYRPRKDAYATFLCCSCDGYMELDGNDTPELLADRIDPTLFYGVCDLYVYYVFGKVNRIKRFKDVLFCANLNNSRETFFRLQSSAGVGTPINQRISFVLTFDIRSTEITHYLITWNG